MALVTAFQLSTTPPEMGPITAKLPGASKAPALDEEFDDELAMEEALLNTLELLLDNELIADDELLDTLELLGAELTTEEELLDTLELLLEEELGIDEILLTDELVTEDETLELLGNELMVMDELLLKLLNDDTEEGGELLTRLELLVAALDIIDDSLLEMVLDEETDTDDSEATTELLELDRLLRNSSMASLAPPQAVSAELISKVNIIFFMLLPASAFVNIYKVHCMSLRQRRRTVLFFFVIKCKYRFKVL